MLYGYVYLFQCQYHSNIYVCFPFIDIQNKNGIELKIYATQNKIYIIFQRWLFVLNFNISFMFKFTHDGRSI